MSDNQTGMPIDLPVTDEAKRKPSINCLQDVLLDLMDERKVSLSQIQKATGIKWSTLMGWHDGAVTSQLADKNLLMLAQFFNVSLEFLIYGIGDESPRFEEFIKEE